MAKNIVIFDLTGDASQEELMGLLDLFAMEDDGTPCDCPACTEGGYGFNILDSIDAAIADLGLDSPTFPTEAPTELFGGTTKVLDVYETFASNMVNTLAWFQYDDIATPEEMDEDDILFIKDYGDGVYGAVLLTDGRFEHQVIRPRLGSVNQQIMETILQAKHDCRAIMECIVPAGPLSDPEVENLHR